MSSASPTVKSEPCGQCGGLGLVRTERGSAPCSCQVEHARRIRLDRAGIPRGFVGATFETYRSTAATRDALLIARRYAEEFPPVDRTKGAGLLFWGTVGTGKTHLASAIAEMLCGRGFQPVFVDVRELLDRLRRSFDPKATETETEIVAPIFKADLVVIDELGATRPTDWAFETLELLIGGLYNRTVPAVVTTNLPNLQAGAANDDNQYARSARPETLGDRIGARMFSRLQQMCRPVEMNGPDWRVRR